MSLVKNVTEYYAERASVYDETAGYIDPESEQLRVPIKARYREMFKDHTVLEIACGTGYWTPIIAEVSKSVLATDINPSLLSQAQNRCRHLSNVTFRIADAYTLEGIPNGFTAAFGNWWWSHIPREDLLIF
ncbi:MAG: methyltransferase domain-containing protein, partial [Chitinispirillia bacterium]